MIEISMHKQKNGVMEGVFHQYQIYDDNTAAAEPGNTNYTQLWFEIKDSYNFFWWD